MKTPSIRVSVQGANKLPTAMGTAIRALPAGLILFNAIATAALAVDATWQGTFSQFWGDNGNWSPPSAPVSAGDTATFGTSSRTLVQLGSTPPGPRISPVPAAVTADSVTINSITFNSGADAFSIETNGNVLTLQSIGIVNKSEKAQTISNTGPNSSTLFTQGATAANATINNINFGLTSFSNAEAAVTDRATAANATITNNGAVASGAGGGITEFHNNSTAGNATIISNGGTGGGTGGTTRFLGTSDGGTAHAITNGNGSFDISGLTSAGMDIGSIEGSGSYLLGGKMLNVGGNNLSTTVSGVIQGAGGSLTKVGTGTLTLSGVNTYSGGTNFNGGVLAINSDANLGTGPLRFNGGTLEALGGLSFFGLTSSKGVVLAADGGTFLADAETASTLSGAITGTGAWSKAGPGTLTLSGTNTYTGATAISAGVLRAGSAGAFSASSAFTVNTGAELDLNGSNNAVGSLSGSGLVTNTGTSGTSDGPLAPATLSVGADNTSTTFGGLLQDGKGTLGLTKVGTGTLILTDDNTYTGGTTINAGTLQLGNGGTTGSIIGNVVNNGILAFNRSDIVTLGGVISGTGSIQQNGIGTTVLVGENTYAGGTTINAGTLQLGNGGTTGSIVGKVTDNGILVLDRSDVLTFNGVISGTGSVHQNGTGTTVLLSDNTYAGGTIINAGTLQLGNGSKSGSIVGNVTDNGILAFNRSDVLTFGGVISGTGSVQQNGIGTTVLVGENTYAGGTTINAGTLQLGNGGTTGSIVGNVTNNGILAFNRSDVFTFGGVISGTGSVQQNGTGTTVLVGKNTYTGATTVNAGSLIVDGKIASAQTLVNTGGLLGGRGTLGGSLVNSGIVSPGDSPGTLTVNSNYTQNAGGTLRIEVAGLGATQHDLLAVGGHASLAGTLQLIRLGDFKLHVGDKLTFLTANGGVSGSFETIQNEFLSGTIVKAEVVNLPNAVVLEGTQGSFVPVACTPNAVAIAHALDSVAGNSRSAELINFLDEQPIDQLCGDLQLIAPEQLASIFNIGVSLANVQTANLNRRMDDIRAGSTGFSSSGFTLNGSAPNFRTGFAGVTGPEGKSGPPALTPTPENRWGVWITGIGEFTNVDSTNNAAGFDIQTGGVTFGVDYRLCPNFAIGLTAGYAHTNADLANGGNLNVNGGTLGLYATLFGGGFYIDTSVTGGPSGYNTHRTALLGSANGSTDGGDFNVLVAGGYDWKKGGLTIGPTASFQYTYVGFDGFTESGSLAPLNVHSQNAESERTAFGMKASYDLKVGHVVIVPQISLAWQHEYGDQAYSIVSSFASGAGTSFTVNSPKVGRDSMLIGAGAAVLLSDRVSIYAYYDGEVFRTNYQSNNVSAGIRVTF